ncbi:MAG: hypothetical protein IPH98_12420 [Saprospiraceae bacterium]|nr:hypothetical protein [Candidatus Defluviibacterium haderslevense]
MRTISFSYYLTEQRNSIKSKIYSAIIILLMLLLVFFYKFKIVVPEDIEAPPYLSLIEFIPQESIKKYEHSGGSKGQDGLETLEGGSQGNADQTPEPESEPVAEKKIEITPVEKIPSSSAATPILTNSEPDIVKLPSPPKINPTTKPTSPSTTTSVPESKSTSSTTTTHTSSGDDDHLGSGSSGTGGGSAQGAGNANTGAGDGSGGGSGGGGGSGTGAGTGDGIGVDLDATGPLKRARIFAPDLKKLASATQQKVVFYVCINREGEITSQSFVSAKSSTKEIKFVREAMGLMKQFKFKANPSAARKECGTVTIASGGVQQRLN